MRTAVVLFTRDLRVHDNPALADAVRRNDRVVPLFVLDEALRDGPHASGRRFAFLRSTLAGLDDELRARGGRLVVRHGDVVAETVRAAREAGADTVYLNADASAFAQRRERRLAEVLEVRSHDGTTVVPLDELVTKAGRPYTVFSPYWRAWRSSAWRSAEPAPPHVAVAPLDSLPLEVDVRSGEPAARASARRFLEHKLRRYDGTRLDAPATSRLSPYLHFGALSPLELALEARERGAEAFVRQLCWRDFYAQLLFHRPALQWEDLHERELPWTDDDEALAAWKEGRTGVPIVDAAMRQLETEGWIPNRARLISASFLVKDLLVDWREGAAHYYDRLLDGDVANNAGNWQWIAGTGTDPRPYRRVYNPVLQARRHDPTGDYVRRHVPELAGVGEEIHEPWKLGPLGLARLGYPEPIVDHAEAARRFRGLVGAAGRA